MFNYANLNDVEFEELCKDVMQKKLSTSLRVFAKGRDGGIDLTDNVNTHSIIIQVKHYIGSKFANLRTTLKKEIDNVHKWNPTQYYICCGMQLTDGNISDVYEMFSDYMKSDENIITLKEIDEFLQKPENGDVVRKHYKLWLYASNILNEIYNQEIFIDCEALLSDIDEGCKFFVQTNIYNQCIEHLDKTGLLMITGGPGVGKTTTSKMLVLYYASQGYRVRYTTNGDISDIKKSLSNDKECKEIVLLDDCLGQHYFHMKSTQENELLSLIKYVKLSNNKKLILNSRITIFNEAKERSGEFNIFFKENKIRHSIINMDSITSLEKAKIFYNHLIYKRVPSQYINSIKENKNYLKIVQHKNYTPRVIEHVTFSFNYLKIIPSKYFDYIHDSLDNPNDIWKNEFERRLQEVDRAFLSTLYSLTDTNVEYSVLKNCFDRRLTRISNIDFTLNNFELVLSRLNESLINVIDNKSKMSIGVINPSVNDYLKNALTLNKLELNEVRNSICMFNQFERSYSKEELSNVYFEYIISEKINEIDFDSDSERNYFISSHICKYNIKNYKYREVIFDYLDHSYCYTYSKSDWLSHIEVFTLLLDKDMYEFYSINEFIEDEFHIYNLFSNLNLDELIETINRLTECYEINGKEYVWFKLLCKKMMNDEILYYSENINVSDYYDNNDIHELLKENTKVYYYSGSEEVDIDIDAITSALEEMISDEIDKEILEKVSNLNEDINSIISLPKSYNLSVREIESAIDSYIKEVDYDEFDNGRLGASYISEIESIFER